jgi:hypothetical protein
LLHRDKEGYQGWDGYCGVIG